MKIISYILFISLLIFLSGCGNDEESTPAQTINDTPSQNNIEKLTWDTASWDDVNWQ